MAGEALGRTHPDVAVYAAELEKVPVMVSTATRNTQETLRSVIFGCWGGGGGQLVEDNDANGTECV